MMPDKIVRRRELHTQDRFHVQQKPTLIINRYRIFLDNGTGKAGHLVAFVEQKRATLKEHVTIYTGEDKQTILAELKARKVLDHAPVVDVTTPEGERIGLFRKNFGASLYRSTWTIEQPGESAVIVSERNVGLAVARRIWKFLPLGDFPFPVRYHFDLVRGDAPIGSVDKTTRLSDHYLVQIADEHLDRRLLFAMAVALDAMQSR